MESKIIQVPPAVLTPPYTTVNLSNSLPSPTSHLGLTNWPVSSIVDENENALECSKAEKSIKTEDQQIQLPEKRPAARRVFSKRFFSIHRRLIAVIFMINSLLGALTLYYGWSAHLPFLGSLVIGNITITVLIRQQRIVNKLFQVATASRTTFPLPVRWSLAKIYHIGGLHSGCGVSALFWLFIFATKATHLRTSGSKPVPSAGLLIVTYLVLILLTIIVILALPPLREKFHNSFEVSHRFLGWFVLALVWAHTTLLINDFKRPTQSLSIAFLSSVVPYLLFILTMSIASPWLLLRRVRANIRKPSDHVIIVHLQNVGSASPGSTSSLSLSPLREWHSFANIPNPGVADFRLVISRAGDWTSQVIDNPPSHFWIKGIPTSGMATVGLLFKHVLYVCTGSGIGPVLPHLFRKEANSSLLWSARSPSLTYGEELVKEIWDSCPNTTIYDTSVLGKPDMVAQTYSRFMKTGAEAVIVIANQKLTRKVVYGMESRGIPAFGAIWDS